MLLPAAAWTEYPTRAFLARETPEALREVLDTADIGDSDKIEIEAPHIASDASMVPVRIRSGYTNTESISRNPYLSFEIPRRKGDLITISCLDNRGNSDSASVKLRYSHKPGNRCRPPCQSRAGVSVAVGNAETA